MNATSAERTLRGSPIRPAPERVNVAEHFVRSARLQPNRAAIIAPHGARGWRVTSYLELEQRCDALANGLVERGVERGDRVALFVRPGADLIAITFALFKLGAVPILIDPGMGREHVVQCLARLKPRVFIGVAVAHVLRVLHARQLGSIEIALVAGRKTWPGQESLGDIARPGHGAFTLAPTARDETAAILFTSGSTGPAKGVVYTHGMFDAQIRALKSLYDLRPLERDLACFPLFALFDAALETTCVFPRIDPLRPARCNPRDIADAILAHGCTYGFGSPAIWRRVVPWAIENGVRFPTLTRALIAGAPVPPALVANLRTLIAHDGDVHTPYGATECLPVSSISGSEFEAGVRVRVEGGHGACLGRAAPGIEIGIVEFGERTRHDDEFVPHGRIGEICVRGAVVTRAYADDAKSTLAARSRIGESDWHRTGDAGYVDADERLWTVGRCAHRIETRTGTRWPVPLENVCDVHPRVRRTACVGSGPSKDQRPCLVIEPNPGDWPRSSAERAAFAAEMRALVDARLRSGSPAHTGFPERVLFHAAFPVDVRHNAKIRREELARFATGLDA